MSYCVNCGVELDGSLKECPLCNTIVINPKELNKLNTESPFPNEKGEVEKVKRKDFSILLSVVLAAIGGTCGILNLLVFPMNAWSLFVIGACFMLWVFFIPLTIHTQMSAFLYIFLDGLSVLVYLGLISLFTGVDRWFWHLGAPIMGLVLVIVESYAGCIKKVSSSFLPVMLYTFSSIAILCVGLEILIDLYVGDGIRLIWSAVVLTACVVLDVAIITLLSRKRLREAVRRRLHF